MIARLAALLALAAWPAAAQSPTAQASTEAPPAPNYAMSAAWACRPEAPGACGLDLDALKVANDGTRTADPFHAAVDPGIDCFYVYPTTSEQPDDFAKPVREPSVDRTISRQAGRLRSRCRVFAPLYRQLTSAGLDRRLQGQRDASQIDWSLPYGDVRAAWREYLRRDNHGRGVVLIAHSQGSILMADLIAKDIEGTPSQRLVISAILAGDPAVLVPKGADVGGSFKSMPLCRAKAQAGCVVAWSTYAADAPATPRFFARDHDGMVAACVNPAAPEGGPAPLHPVLVKPSIAPAGDPPFVEPVGQVSGVCAPDGGGTVLQVSVLPGRFQGLMQALFAGYGRSAGWGLHGLDVGLVEDDILDLIPQQAAAWSAARR